MDGETNGSQEATQGAQDTSQQQGQEQQETQQQGQSQVETPDYEKQIAERDKSGFQAPAMVRVSFGMYNNENEVDTLLKAIAELASNA